MVFEAKGEKCMFKEKWVTADEALSRIKKGSRVFIGSGCGEPQYLVERLVKQAERFFDVEIIHVLSIRDPGYTATGLSGHFRVQTFFVAGRGPGRRFGKAGRSISPFSCPISPACSTNDAWKSTTP